MRARIVAGGIVSSAAILVIGWQLGGTSAVTTSPGSTAGTTQPGGSSSGTQTGSTSGASGSGTTDSASGAAQSASGTFTGTTAQTRYGPVQVQIEVSQGTITDVTALRLTDDGGRSVAISASAAPILRQEALRAQSAHIQSVSGATYTSEGYTTSLQSAIDQAGL